MIADYVSYEMIAITMFATMLLMLLTGQRVFGAIGFVAAMAALLLWGDGAVQMPYTASWKLFKWYPMLTLPLFIYMGYMISESGIADDLYKMFHVYFGGIKGGLAIGTMGMMVAISAMNGLSVAGMAIGATIALPAMLKLGYDKRMITGVVQAGRSLGILVPPSVDLVLYGMIARQPVSKLWLAGILPGIILGIMLMIVVFIISLKNNYGGDGEKFKFRPLLCALWDGKWAVFAPIIILGGIYSGIFTPSEAAAVAVAYGLFVGLFIYKGLTLNKLFKAFKFTAIVIGTVLFILGSTKAFGQLVTIYDIPESILSLFQGIVNYPWLVMLLIGILYIIVGMWLESIPQIIIFTAIFFPLITKIGIDPVVFGIFTVTTCEIGFLTPPIGINLFVAARITKISIEEISIGVLPLLIPYVLMVLILVFFSEWVTYLPDLVYGPTR